MTFKSRRVRHVRRQVNETKLSTPDAVWHPGEQTRTSRDVARLFDFDQIIVQQLRPGLRRPLGRCVTISTPCLPARSARGCEHATHEVTPQMPARNHRPYVYVARTMERTPAWAALGSVPEAAPTTLQFGGQIGTKTHSEATAP